MPKQPPNVAPACTQYPEPAQANRTTSIHNQKLKKSITLQVHGHPIRMAAHRLLGCSLLALTCCAATASEGGGLAVYPDGLENYMVGALPPPGVHLLVYGGALRYDSLRGNNGQSLVPDFKVRTNAVIPRLVWVTPQKLLGGQLVVHAVMPILDIDFRANGAHFKNSGVGDITLGAGLGYHASAALHSIAGVDVVTPTGSYDRNDPASLGKNHWAIQPFYAVTYTQASGLNADLKAMYDFNLRNKDTRTRSGQALHADYSIGWGLGNGWVIGAGGHVFQQVSDDKGPNSAQGKARAFGFGPSIRYANEHGWLVTLKWQKEFEVRNRPQGSQLYLKAVIPF